MLSRKLGALLTSPHKLCEHVPKGKLFLTNKHCQMYSSNGYIMHLEEHFEKGLELLKKGFIWRIGNGENVNMAV